ncbi:lactate/malate family dehydrogenase [Alteromonas gilva]|uniref:NAD(P)-binding domain-containing protein n=1 Tax=Alteromonas gilva TaxID=2987522 RepID=A0ABT5L4G4_9ALTE|nr:NAD(P)-binding domain-containing protein [Alteromonas gilva]MDC8831935.1 NAD(P)-binding domain-containing protein [Alteromonas gilva]
MTRHVAIVGCGNVGGALAHSLINKGIVNELTLIDSDLNKVTSHATDLRDALVALDEHVTIRVNDTAAMLSADVIVVALGPRTISTLDRLAEYASNKASIIELAHTLHAADYDGIVLNITNPCDVITQVLQQESGLPASRVFGTGTALDTLRLKRVLSELLGVSPADVAGYVAGEHGDSQFIVWSSLRVAGQAVENSLSDELKAQLEKQVADLGSDIYAGKQCTEFGIAAIATNICTAILTDSRRVFSVSVYDREAGCYISHPSQVGSFGLGKRFTLHLNASEQRKFRHSADIIGQHAVL